MIDRVETHVWVIDVHWHVNINDCKTIRYRPVDIGHDSVVLNGMLDGVVTIYTSRA